MNEVDSLHFHYNFSPNKLYELPEAVNACASDSSDYK